MTSQDSGVKIPMIKLQVRFMIRVKLGIIVSVGVRMRVVFSLEHDMQVCTQLALIAWQESSSPDPVPKIRQPLKAERLWNHEISCFYTS